MFDQGGIERAEAAADNLVDALSKLVVRGCDADALARIVALLCRVQGCIDASNAHVATQTVHLFEAGRSAPPEEVLVTAGRMSARDAVRVTRRAETLAEAPALAEALSSGAISGAHADALANATSKLTPDVRAALVDRHRDLAKRATKTTPEEFGRHCRRLADQLSGDDGLSRSERQRRETRLRHWVDEVSGMYRIDGRFDVETGTKVFTALNLEIEALRANCSDSAVVGDLATDNEHLAAHALSALLSAGHRERRPGIAEVCVHVDDRTIRDGLHELGVCEFADGTQIPVGMARRLACEAEIIPIVYGAAGEVLDVGRGQRLANRAQRRAARAMHRTCAWHGCRVAFERCHLHHIVPWHAGGRSDLANLVPLCSRHHHRVHEGGWTIRFDTERTLHITRPDGTLHASVPLERNRRRRRREPDDRRTTHLPLPVSAA